MSNTGLSIQLDEEQLATAVAAGLMAQLGEEGRNNLIAQAIRYLLTDAKNEYGRRMGETPIQTAVNNAVARSSHKIAEEYVAAHPEFQAAITAEMEKAVAGMLANREGVRYAVMTALSRVSLASTDGE